MNTRRTCDRCYKIKARCAYEGAASSCARCLRLGHVCLSKRAVLRAGRPRTNAKNTQTPESESASSRALIRTYDASRVTPEVQLHPVLTGFKDYEMSLVEFILHPDQIASLVYGQSFRDDMRSNLVSGLLTATQDLKEGLLAFAQAMSDNKKIQFSNLAQSAHAENGSRALQKLRRFEGSSLDDARTALGLALMLVTYNDLKVGAPTLPISRSALLRAAPWREQLICDTTEQTDPNIVCLLFIEMFECLVLAEIPVFRVEPLPSNTIVDRYYGISHELLPYMYDICILFRDIKNSAISRMDKGQRIDRINVWLTMWNPEVVLAQRGHLIPDESEKSHFLLQAKAFKLAVQLLLLQAQRDPITDMLVSSRAAQLQSLVHQAMEEGPDRPKYLLFPYFISCLEMNTSNDATSDKVLHTMNEISNGIAPKSCQSMLACLKHIWTNKRRKPSLCWFECIDANLLFAMGP